MKWFKSAPRGLVRLSHLAHIQVLKESKGLSGSKYNKSLKNAYVEHCANYHDSRPCESARKALGYTAPELSEAVYRALK